MHRNAHHPPDPRRIALRVLTTVEERQLPLDAATAQNAGSIDAMGPLDRALFNTLLYGVLRWRNRLDWEIEALSTTPFRKIAVPVRNILRMGLFQMTSLDRVPDAAAIHTSVELAKSEGGPWVHRFVNALLRARQRRQDPPPLPDPDTNPAGYLAVAESHPEWLVRRWIDRYGYSEAEALCRADNAVPAICLRTNRLRTDRRRLLEALGPHVEEAEPVDALPDALRIRGIRTPVGRMPPFLDGWFQVQDGAAQLVSHLLGPVPGERVIDACAGRGGKTGHLAQLMANRGELLAMDLDPAKLEALAAEMERLGVTNVRTAVSDLTAADPEAEPVPAADRVLVDAPCSGLGVLRRHPEARWLREKRNLTRFADRQLALLERASRWVKPGGCLVYAVCSLEPEEGPDVVAAFLDRHRAFAQAPAAETEAGVLLPFVDPAGRLCTLPHRHGMDGFFAVRLTKIL